MSNRVSKFLIKPLLMLAIAIPAFASINVSNADAGSRNKRAAIIAGAVIGGVIGYQVYKGNKRKKQRHYQNSRYKQQRHVRHRDTRRGHRNYRSHRNHGNYHYQQRRSHRFGGSRRHLH